MIKILSSSWMAALIGAIIYLVATVYFWEFPKPPPKATTTITSAFANYSGPSWAFSNPEADQLMSELKSEKKALELRERQLDELSTRLQTERAELGQVTQSVRQLESNFDNSVVRVKQEESVNLKRLAKIYGTMPPDSAASVLAEMDNTAFVKILLFLKDDQNAAILDALAKQGEPQARRAAELSDMIRVTMHEPATK